MAGQTFLISSEAPPPGRCLIGHAFDGPDLILGTEGQARFEERSGRTIRPGGDGAYLVANRTSQVSAVVGTDFAGNHQLYLYRHGRHWAVSNSIPALVAFARGQDWPVTLDAAQLSAIFVFPRMIGDQLMSFATAVKEIRLVPARMQLAITETMFGRRLALQPAAGEPLSDSYAAGLDDYVTDWVERLATLLSSDLDLLCEAGAGAGDRAVLGLLAAARRVLGDGATARLRVRALASRGDGGARAEDLLQVLDLPNAAPADLRPPGSRRDSAEAYALWRAHLLGTYMPFRVPAHSAHPGQIWLTANGAGAYRTSYAVETLADLIESCRPLFPDADGYETVRQQAEEALETLRSGFEFALDEPILHYRHFRERLHFGHRKQFSHTVCPLAGRALRAASCRPGSDMARGSKAVLDVIARVAPELLRLPFDRGTEAFDPDAVPDPAVDGQLAGRIGVEGRVYGPPPPAPDGSRFLQSEVLELLRSDLYRSTSAVRRLDFFPPQYLADAKRKVDAAIEAGRFAHPRDGTAAAHVIFAASLLPG